jgi:hypothetical protein
LHGIQLNHTTLFILNIFPQAWISPCIYLGLVKKIDGQVGPSIIMLSIQVAHVLCMVLWPWPWVRDQGKGLQRCEPRMKPKSHISCSQECRRMWRNEPTHSQMGSHFGNWSFDGLLNFLRAISKVKTHLIENFLISLKIS